MKLCESQLLQALGMLPGQILVDLAQGTYVNGADIRETVQAMIEQHQRRLPHVMALLERKEDHLESLVAREQAVEKAERHWRKLRKALKSLEVDE